MTKASTASRSPETARNLRRKKGLETVQMVLKVPAELKEALQLQMTRSSLPLSAIVIQACRDYLRKEGALPDPATNGRKGR